MLDVSTRFRELDDLAIAASKIKYFFKKIERLKEDSLLWERVLEIIIIKKSFRNNPNNPGRTMKYCDSLNINMFNFIRSVASIHQLIVLITSRPSFFSVIRPTQTPILWFMFYPFIKMDVSSLF